MAVKTYSLARDGNTFLSPHFQVREFRSKDGTDRILINSDLIAVLEKLYDHMNAKAININSGYRTPAYSVKVKGYATDQHTKGNAADIKVKKQDGSYYSSNEVCCALEDLNHQGGVGRINKEYAVHVDVRGCKCWFDETNGMKTLSSWYSYLGVKKSITASNKAPKLSGAKTGVDLSHHNNDNGPVDFSKLKAAGVEFVILHAGYGRYANQKDPFFESNYKAAKDAGLPVGAYWYSYATDVAGARAEAQTFLQTIKGKQFEYPVYFDLEEPKQFKTGKTNVSAMVAAFCSTVEAAGYFTGVYMSASYLREYVTDEVKKRYTLWVAQFASKCTYSGAGSVAIWQATSKGRINGVIGNVDVNFAYVDFPTEIKTKGLNGFVLASGDLDGDGKVTAKDARLALRIAAGLAKATLYQLRVGDLNGNGKIDSSDARMILRKAAKLK